ncbi:CHC2 zinc finger domain-containing protein [Dongia sp.]|uniref:CHC2 zinc finger domain-containing protein n=1 Tax=Dongia sp. TaxID=1977262 RepID=UPI003752DDA7
MAELVSFDDLKALVSIEEVATWLGIQTKPSGTNGALRGKCPLCSEDRTFTITPAKGLFGCFKCQKRGSILDLVHHVRRTKNVREAALLIQEQFLGDAGGKVPSQELRKSTVPAERNSTVPARQEAPQSPLKPLEHLTTNHPAIEVLGLTAGACTAIGIGYTSKGMMRGRVAIPLRLPDGSLVGYLGIATSGDQQPLLLFPKNLEEKATAAATPAAEKETSEPKKPAEELRKLFRVVG